jgi:hypothetical protein
MMLGYAVVRSKVASSKFLFSGPQLKRNAGIYVYLPMITLNAVHKCYFIPNICADTSNYSNLNFDTWVI